MYNINLEQEADAIINNEKSQDYVEEKVQELLNFIEECRKKQKDDKKYIGFIS